MKVSTVKEFRDKATQFMRDEGPILITRHGHLAGIYMSMEEGRIPLEFEFRKQLQLAIAGMVRAKIKKKGFKEKDILADFEKHRKARGRR